MTFPSSTGVIKALAKRPVVVMLISHSIAVWPENLAFMRVATQPDLMRMVATLADSHLILIDVEHDSQVVSVENLAAELGFDHFLLTDLPELDPTPSRSAMTASWRRTSYDELIRAATFAETGVSTEAYDTPTDLLESDV